MDNYFWKVSEIQMWVIVRQLAYVLNLFAFYWLYTRSFLVMYNCDTDNMKDLYQKIR